MTQFRQHPHPSPSRISSSPPRRPWRQDSHSSPVQQHQEDDRMDMEVFSTAAQVVVAPHTVSPDTSRVRNSPPKQVRIQEPSWQQEDEDSTFELLPVVVSPPTTPPKSESKREEKIKKRAPKKRRKPRYPLDGTTPSERILASMVCCADMTLDVLERSCGIEEEMQTINNDVAWCVSFL